MVGGRDDVTQDSLQGVVQIDAAGGGGLEQEHHRLLAITADTSDVEHVVDALERRHQFTPLDVLAALGEHLQQPRTGRSHADHGVAQPVLDVRAQCRTATVSGVGAHAHLANVFIDSALRHAHDQRRNGTEENLVERIQVVRRTFAVGVLNQAVGPMMRHEGVPDHQALAAGAGQAEGVPVIFDDPRRTGHQH
ncbi:hypothetical protein D3C80_1463560 [compost metagenome]